MSETVSVYETLPARRILDSDTKIAQTLFGLQGRRDGSQALTISEISGCIRYYDAGEIWKNSNPGALAPDAVTAQKVAQAWLDKARQRLNSKFVGTPLALLIPRNTVHVVTVPAKDFSQRYIDHWLSLFVVHLPTGRLEPQFATAPVDCAFELRIGRVGRPVAFVSTWRPFTHVQRVELVPLPNPKAQLFYRMEAPEAPQKYIAPYYFASAVSNDGDPAGTIVPATESHSPMVQITQERTVAPVQLKANVIGVKSRLVFSWGYWRIDQPISHALNNSSAAITITDPGIYNVVVDVGRQELGGLIPLVRAQALVYVTKKPTPVGITGSQLVS